jgi:phytoene dehydrogenase-like protein
MAAMPAVRRKPPPRVHVVGGGISGLTAALRLAERGYKVTVYEEKTQLGGNLAARDGLDVYPHLFGTHYHNFWTLAERDLKLRRGEGGDFEPRYTFKVLEKDKFPRYLDMLNVGSPAAVWSSLIAGVAPPAELLLAAYSLIDALSYSDADDDVLDEVSVDGFLRTRPYATDTLSKLHNTIIMTIWSVHSHETSAAAYRRFLAPNVPLPVPLLWLLTGDLQKKLIGRLKDAIESHPDCGFDTNARVVNAVVQPTDGKERPWRVTRLDVKDTRFNPKENRWTTVGDGRQVYIAADDAVILAVPPGALAFIIAPRHGWGEVGYRIVDKLPQLSQVRRLRGEPIPVLHLALTRKIENIPKEHVLLRDSAFDMTFIDLSQVWHDDDRMKYDGKERTFLCVAASDYWAFPISDDQNSTRMAVVRKILEELVKYVPTISEADIDYNMSRFESNTDRMLFLNSVGGKQWQPETHYPKDIANLFFAGDLTRNPIMMATVEAAVVSGLQAAQKICEQKRHGEAIEILTADSLPRSSLLALKTMLAPWAYGAKCWSRASDVVGDLAKGDAGKAKVSLARALTDAYATSGEMAIDLWQSLVLAAAESCARALQPALQGPKPVRRRRARGERRRRGK